MTREKTRTKKGDRKKKKKKGTVGVGGGDGDKDHQELTEAAPERPWSSCSQATDTEECQQEVKKLSFEDEKELWWAQADHIRGLSHGVLAARAQKKKAEAIEKKRLDESFLLAEAMGMDNLPERPKAARTEERFAQFLEESIKTKEKDLECPVCLEVAFMFPHNLEYLVFAIFLGGN